jgi:hypothetical protein
MSSRWRSEGGSAAMRGYNVLSLVKVGVSDHASRNLVKYDGEWNRSKKKGRSVTSKQVPVRALDGMMPCRVSSRIGEKMSPKALCAAFRAAIRLYSGRARACSQKARTL